MLAYDVTFFCFHSDFVVVVCCVLCLFSVSVFVSLCLWALLSELNE